MALVWESAGTDEPGDQNADSLKRVAPNCTSAYYSLGPDITRGTWCVEIIQIRDGEEQDLAGEGIGQDFPTEQAAKDAAQAFEDDETGISWRVNAEIPDGNGWIGTADGAESAINEWAIRRTEWGLSLFYEGKLVASADRLDDLVKLLPSDARGVFDLAQDGA